MRDGSAWLRGSHFQNGTIEFDIAFSDSLGFPGIAFRAASHGDYELFYLRENLSGQPHATQYTPVLHGLYAWQIYVGAPWEASARWTFDRWMHVKLVVSGTRAALYVDGDSAIQVVPRLRGPEAAGEVGFVVAPGAARFANLVVRPEREAPRLVRPHRFDGIGQVGRRRVLVVAADAVTPVSFGERSVRRRDCLCTHSKYDTRGSRRVGNAGSLLRRP